MWLLRHILNNDKMSKNFKISNFVKKNNKIRGVEIFKRFHYKYKLYGNLFSKPRGGSLANEVGETKKLKKSFKKLEKASFIRKNC